MAKEPLSEKMMRLLLGIEQKMATKADIKRLKEELEDKMATKADLRDYATKNDLENMEERIMEVFKPTVKAVDRNSEIIVNHERRLVALEGGKPVGA